MCVDGCGDVCVMCVCGGDGTNGTNDTQLWHQSGTHFLPISEPFDPAGGLYKCKTDGASKHKLGCLDQSNMVPNSHCF
jgi:hypothetical protein